MVVVALLLGAMLPGCTPNCETVCKTLHGCPALDLQSTPEAECVLNCQLQENAYEKQQEDEDTGFLEDFETLKTCIVDSTCPALAEGACYDSDLYSY